MGFEGFVLKSLHSIVVECKITIDQCHVSLRCVRRQLFASVSKVQTRRVTGNETGSRDKPRLVWGTSSPEASLSSSYKHLLQTCALLDALSQRNVYGLRLYVATASSAGFARILRWRRLGWWVRSPQKPRPAQPMAPLGCESTFNNRPTK